MLKKIAAISCAVILCSSLIIPSPRIEHSNVAIVNAAEGEKSYTDKYDVTYSFTVDTSDNTACLTGVSNAKADLILPSTVSSNGSTYTVTKIGEYFARKNTVIKSVTIPDSIYYLGHGCFRETTNLANIYGANSIKEVGMYSFYNTKWDNNIEDNQGYCILGKAFFKNYSKKNTIDLSSNKYDNIEYICESSFTPSSSTMEKLILPKNITCISRDALQGHHTVNQRHILNEVKFYDKSLNQYVDLYDVCMSENKNAFQSEFLDNFYETFDLTSLCDRITIDYTKGFFKDLGINYIGSTDNTGYSAWEEYKIVLKIYKYIGQNFTKYNNSDTMNSNFKSELFNHHGIACIAYADMLKYFCNAAGIKCEEVSSGSEGGHFWNNVNIHKN